MKYALLIYSDETHWEKMTEAGRAEVLAASTP